MATISPDFIDPPVDPTDPTNEYRDDNGGPQLPMPGDAGTTDAIASGMNDTTTRHGAVNQDYVVSSAPSPSPGDILQTATGPQLPVPGGPPQTPYDIQAAATNANGGPAQHPQTAEQMAFQNQHPNGGSFTNPNPGSGLSIEQQAFQGQHPNGGSFNAQGQQTGGFTPSGLPTPGSPQPNPGGTNFITRLGDQTPTGGTPGVGAGQGGGLPPQYANDPWARQFFEQNGYFDPRFNTADSIKQELLRGGSANWEQAQRMRGANGDVDAIVDAINRVGAGNYFNSQNAQQWGGAHNQQITSDVNNGVYGHNQAAIANVASQRVNPIANPIDQSHAELTNAMQQSLTDSLKALGASGVHSGFDSYGNATIDYFNKSGQPESIKATFVDLANAIDQLRQRAATSQQAPPGGGGGGGNGYGGGRGGYAPPGGGGPPGGPPGGNPRPAPEVFPDGRPVPPALGGYPTGVQSAYAFTPAITPGGYSPYDEPTPGMKNYGDTNFQPSPGTVGFGPFPPGSAGNPGQANGSNPEQRYANSPPSAAPIPVELVGQPPEVIAEMRRRGIIP